MKIFYFSGTGNSYSVARQLCEELHCDMLSIPNYLHEPFWVEDDAVGFVTPTYCTDLPPVVAQFLEKLLLRKVKYLFGISTMGALTGRTLYHAQSILKKKGTALAGSIFRHFAG